MNTRQPEQHCDAGATEFQTLNNPMGHTEHKASDAKQLNLSEVGLVIKSVARPIVLQF